MAASQAIVPPPPGALRLLLQDAQTFFITIAVLLGAGILSVPVKLVDCGLWPFLAIFTLTLGMQLTIVYVSCDLVEIAKQSLPRSDLHTIGKRYLSPLLSLVFDVLVLITFLSTLVSYALAGSKAFVDLAQLISPSASSSSAAVITPFVWACTLGIVFLEGVIKPVIAVGTGAKVVLLCFIIGIVGMVSSQVGLHPHSSWADLLQPFLVGTVAIGGIGNMAPAFYDSYLLRPPPAAAAAAVPAAGAADAVTVVATPVHVHGASVDAAAVAVTSSESDDSKAAAAAAAAALAASRAFYARARRHFRASMLAGIVTCYALNILWAAFVLGIVPQTDADAASYTPPFPTSLQSAARNGDPATIPVNRIIDDRYARYAWVASTVKIFITLSIVVSYNAVGLGLKHVLDGMAATGFKALAARCRVSAAAVRDAVHFWGGGDHGGHGGHSSSGGHAHSANEGRSCTGSLLRALGCGRCGASLAQLRSSGAARGMVASRALAYAAVFGAVWGLALANPQGFVTVLEVFTSLTLNSSGGVFIVVMYLAATLPRGLGGAGAPHLPALPSGEEPSGAAAALAADAAASASATAAAAAAAFDDVRTPLLTGERASAASASASASDAGFRAGGSGAVAPAATASGDAATAVASAAAAARVRTSSKASEDSDGDGEAALTGLPPVDEVPLRPRVLGLAPSSGRLLSHFALITFLLACWYDPFNTALGKINDANDDPAATPDAAYAGAALALGAAIVLFWGWAVRPYVASLLWLDARCWPGSCRVHVHVPVPSDAGSAAEEGTGAIVRAASSGSQTADASHLHLHVTAGGLATLPRMGSAPGIALGDMHAHAQSEAEAEAHGHSHAVASSLGAVNGGAGALARRNDGGSSGSVVHRTGAWLLSVLRSRRLDEPTAPLLLCVAGVLLHAQAGASVSALAVAGAGVAVATHLLASVFVAAVVSDGLVAAARAVDAGAAAAVAAAAFTAFAASPVATAVGVVIAIYAAIRAGMAVAVLRSPHAAGDSTAHGHGHAHVHGAGSPVATAIRRQ